MNKIHIVTTLSLLSLLTPVPTKMIATPETMEKKPMQTNQQPPIMDLTPLVAKQILSTFPTTLIVDFYAEWCGPCKTMKPDFEKVALELSGKYTFAKLDIDQCKEVALEYKIHSIPTIGIFQGGKLIEKIIGLQTKESLMEKIAKALSTPTDLSQMDQATLNEKLLQAVQSMATVEDVKRLLDAGADANAVSDQSMTPLMIILFTQAPMGLDATAMVQLLLDHGASTEFVHPRAAQAISASDCVASFIARNKATLENFEKLAAIFENAKTHKTCTDESCSI